MRKELGAITLQILGKVRPHMCHPIIMHLVCVFRYNIETLEGGREGEGEGGEREGFKSTCIPVLDVPGCIWVRFLSALDG